MLNYREINYSEDVPEIIRLLRSSLSENHTESSFLWKHTESPFGKSYGLLACDDSKIVGVRMFMYWDFYGDGKKLKAIRPVDTITHPDYRGKGIFKKLTLQGLEVCLKNVDIVFNTPNENSKPGYLKMGWKNYPTQILFKVALVFPFGSGKSRLNPVATSALSLREVDLSRHGFCTHVTQEFIQWRYKDPVYKAVNIGIDNEEVIIIYRVETFKGVKMLVIIEALGKKNYRSLALHRLCQYHNIYVVYYLENNFTGLKFSIKRNKSVVVYRNDKKNIIDKISFSAGDLEGRL
ncbi:GNAT family N-acetyltransferase [Autumnicola musiva]|uniref:GNAT family N-acetyltransferase n=1 Tax=Autumnicola musiva TaxID=3075589 RepID=A0ABU3D8X1_9FLAO|nr:GNAT family N-acetyltransferase [Zunongwangia sp. F117]MDT0677463.1 GNAT family N-acetyltransferase [Zunongwangia sp. F117]